MYEKAKDRVFSEVVYQFVWSFTYILCGLVFDRDPALIEQRIIKLTDQFFQLTELYGAIFIDSAVLLYCG